MTEEMNVEKKEKCNCICCSEGFRDFLKIAAGSFAGVFLALTLFAALHKPPMMRCCPFVRPMTPPPMHYQFDRGMKRPDGGFHKKFEKPNFNREIPTRVNVEK